MKKKARIYKPAKNVMQSGATSPASTAHRWVLDYVDENSPRAEPLMGWISGNDTESQIILEFDDLKSAISYASEAGLDYEVLTESKQPKKFASQTAISIISLRIVKFPGHIDKRTPFYPLQTFGPPPRCKGRS